MPFLQCEGANQCILKAQLCNGVQDCPNNSDEIHCTEEFCRKHKKFKCPFENKCIEEKFAGDDDSGEGGDSKWHSNFARNKCQNNTDETNSYIEKCHRENHFICPRKTDALQDIENHCVSLDQSCIAKENLNVTKYIDDLPRLHPTSQIWPPCSFNLLPH